MMSTTTSHRSGRTLLGVWAHPDDEAFLSAGLMAEHVARGDRVVVVTATLGEHGTDHPGRWPPARLAARRHRELRRSLAAVGVREYHLLGFEDGACRNGDGTDAIARHIADVRPDTIVTFGPDGLTGHPDHRAISRWTTDAWSATRPGCDLWYTTVTDDFHDRWHDVNERVGFWFDQPELPRTPHHELCRSITLSPTQLDAKVAALRAHRSQTTRIVRSIGARAFRQWWSTEVFRAARPERASALDGWHPTGVAA
jgi:LmbE family N-acetylglucosaminyl deacetylase